MRDPIDQRLQNHPRQLAGLKNYNIKIKLSFVIEDETAKDGDKKVPEFIDSGILFENGNKCVLKGKEFLLQGVILILSFRICWSFTTDKNHR